MKNLLCAIQDPDSFTNSLLEEYITKTPGITLIDQVKEPSRKADILFVDADQVSVNSSIEIDISTQVVIVSSNDKYIHSLFKDHIADYLSKSDLTYQRFMQAVEKVRAKTA